MNLYQENSYAAKQFFKASLYEHSIISKCLLVKIRLYIPFHYLSIKQQSNRTNTI